MSKPVHGCALEGTLDELIVYFASQALDGPAGTDRHMAEALGRYGPVLYVDPPISALAPLGRQASPRQAPLQRLEVVGPRLARSVTRGIPGLTRPLLRALVGPMVTRAVRSALAGLFPSSPPQPVAGVISSRVEPLWAAVPARRRLFYATDDLPSGAALLGISRRRLLADEARTLAGADAVAVVSPALQQRYAQAGYAATFVPNGCSPEAYAGVDAASPPPDVALAGPVAGFVGHINDRIDLRLLEAVASAGCSLLLVGPIVAGYRDAPRFAELARRPNVCSVGAKPYAELPRYLRLIDVGLTPYADTAFNRASFPLKTLEYLAAGRAVVSTPLPANDWLATELIEVAPGPEGFALRVRAALATTRTPELAERRRAFARQHSWARRAAEIAALLALDAPLRA
jgi:teichuronic acid biosynthesis glycosyltransferase TuaH